MASARPFSLTVLSGLFSRICLACREHSGRGSLCSRCAGHPVFHRPPGVRILPCGPVRSLFRDEGPAGILTRLAKRQGDRRALEALLERMDLSGILPGDARLLVPVPPSRKRLLFRGLSVPDSFALGISDFSGIPCRFTGLRRTSDFSQKSRTRLGRSEAFFSGSFAADSPAIQEMPLSGIVLVDDLLVTGWTLRALREVLIGQGRSVSAMVTLLWREREPERSLPPFS